MYNGWGNNGGMYTTPGYGRGYGGYPRGGGGGYGRGGYGRGGAGPAGAGFNGAGGAPYHPAGGQRMGAAGPGAADGRARYEANKASSVTLGEWALAGKVRPR